MAETFKACCSPGTTWAQETKGEEGSIAGFDAYIAVPKEKPTAALVLISDVFGWQVPNIRLYADKYAEVGFLVVIPDFFSGQGGKFTFDKIKDWLAQFPHEKMLPEVKKVVAEVRSSYGVERCGAQGFCWGGHYAVYLLADGDIDAGVIAHGSLITAEDVEAIKKPVLFLFSDNDRQIPTELRQQIEGILKQKSAHFPAEGMFYPGMEHGWAIRGDDKDEKVAAAAQDAFARGKTFFTQHLL